MDQTYIVYGVPFATKPDSVEELRWLLKLVVPDILDKYGREVWKHFDENSHSSGYYLLHFPRDKKLVLCCWWDKRLSSARGANLLDMPSKLKMAEFEEWCVVRGIDVEDIGFYMLST